MGSPAVEPASRHARDVAALVELAAEILEGSSWLDAHEIREGATRRRRIRVSTLTKRLAAAGATRTAWLSLEPRYPLDVLQVAEKGALGAWKRLVAMARLERREIGLVVIYAVFVGILSLVIPVTVQALVNTIAFGTLIQPLIILTLALVVALTFGAVLQALRLYVIEIIQRRLLVRVAGDFGQRLPRIAYPYRDKVHVPELVNRFYDVIMLQKAGAGLLLDALGLALQTVMGLLLLAFYHPVLLAFDVVLVAALVGLVWIAASSATRTALEESKAKHEVAAWLESVGAAPLAVGGLTASAQIALRTDAVARRWLSARAAHWRRLVVQIAGGLSLSVLSSAVLLGLGGWLVIEGQLTLGQLVAAELVVAALGAGFAKIGSHLAKLYNALAAVDKLGKVVSAPREPDGGISLTPGRPMRLELDGVAHGARLGATTVFAMRGDRVAVTGAGKTTLLEIAAGLRPPVTGRVLFDGHPAQGLDPQALRGQIMLLGDEHGFIAGSIADNLRLGRPTAPTKVLVDALSAAGLAIAALPRGLDTELLPTGAPLSRTERRRLLLARALVERPRLLLIDEILDETGVDDPDALLDRVLGPDAPWTAVVATRSPAVISRATHTLTLEKAP